jgi:rod shape-determining protein MreD
MPRRNFSSVFFSFICFSVALTLAVIGLPDWLDQWRPLWLLLVMYIWFLTSPNNVGLTSAFFAGLVLDLLLGDPLGVNALCFCVVILICHFQYLRLRRYSELQRAWFFAVLVVTYQTCYLLLQLMVGSNTSFSIIFAPTLTSCICWLLLSAPISHLQRHFGVS